MLALGIHILCVYDTYNHSKGARAQDSDTCTEVTVDGLLDDDFPAAGSVYTNSLADDDTVRGTYIDEGNEHFIW